MQRLEVSGAVRPLYGSLGVKGFKNYALKTWEIKVQHHTFVILVLDACHCSAPHSWLLHSFKNSLQFPQ